MALLIWVVWYKRSELWFKASGVLLEARYLIRETQEWDDDMIGLGFVARSRMVD